MSPFISFESKKAVWINIRKYFETSIFYFLFVNKDSCTEILREANNKLREQIICKVCVDEDVACVFIPCGHLVCCLDCAPAMMRCPVCDKAVSRFIVARIDEEESEDRVKWLWKLSHVCNVVIVLIFLILLLICWHHRGLSSGIKRCMNYLNVSASLGSRGQCFSSEICV